MVEQLTERNLALEDQLAELEEEKNELVCGKTTLAHIFIF